MHDQHYVIHTATREEVDLAVAWAAEEGWNPGVNDAACYHAADPEGFLVGRLDGAPAATISAVRYGDAFGFLGFYIVRPDLRGNGYGWAIWQAAMARLEGRVVGLDGVVAQQANYRKSGFGLAYRNVRYQGRAGGASAADPGVVELCSLPFDEVAAFEQPFFPAERAEFLRAWIGQPESAALGLLEDGLVGYGVIRRCLDGWKVGPLYVNEAGQAERLLAALTARIPAGETFFLDVPEANPAAVALARGHAMEVVFETARMYRGPAPALPVDRIFGVASFEIG
ncbi:GNAT family N-acetyltransferase [Endothiovibrio diazotrophicus]